MRSQLIKEIHELKRLIEQEKGRVRSHKDTVEALKYRDRERIARGRSHIIG
jgi:hypothetical protein